MIVNVTIARQATQPRITILINESPTVVTLNDISSDVSTVGESIQFCFMKCRVSLLIQRTQDNHKMDFALSCLSDSRLQCAAVSTL